MSKYNVQAEGPFTFTAAAAIGANKLVVLDSAAKIVHAGAASKPFGLCYDAVANAANGVVTPLTGIFQGVAGTGGIVMGDYVKVGADGTIVAEATVTTITVNTIGQAVTTAADTADCWVMAL